MYGHGRSETFGAESTDDAYLRLAKPFLGKKS